MIKTTKSLLKKGTIVLPCFEKELPQEIINSYKIFIPANFSGAHGEIIYSFVKETQRSVILLGMGKQNVLNDKLQYFRKAVSLLHKHEGDPTWIVNHLSQAYLEQISVAIHLQQYEIGSNKSDLAKKTVKQHFLLTSSSVNTKKHQALSVGIQSVFELVNLPSNIKTPFYIADYIYKSAKENGYTCKLIKGTNALQKANLHALAAVGRASDNEPVLAFLEYKPTSITKKTKTLGLVGKGVTFDTGGISLKQPNNMHYMKCDMAGAAACIGFIETAALLKLNVHIVCALPFAENAVSGKAYKPGDIIKTYSGKTIEVIDTDAEGRIVLADGLSYLIKQRRPEFLIDLATLTGSCVATLGYAAAGLFTNNESLATQLQEAGNRSAEKTWRLPLWDDYSSALHSDVADVKNLSSTPLAGAITAAKFLEYFTEKHEKWAHLDIAGVSFTDSEMYKSKSASGYGVRLLLDFVEQNLI
jgi:leucyl aminopeptidase